MHQSSFLLQRRLMRRSRPMSFLRRRRRATFARKHQSIETLLPRALESTQSFSVCLIADHRARIFLSQSLDTLSRRVGVTQVLPSRCRDQRRRCGWEFRGVDDIIIISPRNVRQMTTHSDPYRSRKQPLEPIRIFIVLLSDGLVPVNSFGCEEVEARLGIFSAQRHEADPADRIRTANVEIVFFGDTIEHCCASSDSSMVTSRKVLKGGRRHCH